MTQHDTRLTESKEYAQLIAVRHRIIWPLLTIVIAVYMAFILTIAFTPESLGQPIGEGVISIGLAIGIAMILFMFLITLIYVRLANKKIEPLIATLHKLSEAE